MRPTVGAMVVSLLVLPCTAAEKGISLRLFVPDSTICTGASELAIELELRNTSLARREVEVASVGAGFDAVALYSTVSNAARFETLQIVGDHIARPAGASISLKPGASHAVRGTIVLDRSFFSEPGFYKIRTEYYKRAATQKTTGVKQPSVQVVSNWAIVQVEPCSNNSPLRGRRRP